MGKLIFVRGTNSSGKSLFAEKLISLTQGKRYYIATMISSTQENHKRIEKHIAQRAGLNFETLELPYGFIDVQFEENSVVLLEDVSNLLANLMFGKKADLEAAFREISTLCEKCGTLVAVSISDLSGVGYEGETLEYINSLNTLNEMLGNMSHAVIEMENRVPVIKKGEIDFADESIFNSPVNL